VPLNALKEPFENLEGQGPLNNTFNCLSLASLLLVQICLKACKTPLKTGCAIKRLSRLTWAPRGSHANANHVQYSFKIVRGNPTWLSCLFCLIMVPPWTPCQSIQPLYLIACKTLKPSTLSIKSFLLLTGCDWVRHWCWHCREQPDLWWPQT